MERQHLQAEVLGQNMVRKLVHHACLTVVIAGKDLHEVDEIDNKNSVKGNVEAMNVVHAAAYLARSPY